MAARSTRRGKPPPRRRHRIRKTLAILSRKRSLYATRRLVEAVKARGHRSLVLDTLRCNLVIANSGPRMIYRGMEVRGLDVAIPRIGASITAYGLAVVRHLEQMGVPVCNRAQGIASSRDKLRCRQLLAREGLLIPRTVMAHDRSNLARLVEEVGGLPAIIKLIRGTQGVGVMIASTLAEVQTILDTFWVVGAMRRQAKKGEFRSNIHRGGAGTVIRLQESYERAAVRAAQLVGLEVAGVDMLESRDGPKIMEINSSPGFEGLERATRLDVAGAIVDHALAYAERQRAQPLVRGLA